MQINHRDLTKGGSVGNKEDVYFKTKIELEIVMERYYKSCLEIDCDIVDDLKDIVHDVTNGEVEI